MAHPVGIIAHNHDVFCGVHRKAPSRLWWDGIHSRAGMKFLNYLKCAAISRLRCVVINTVV